MSKRARYDGPFDKVRVAWPPGETRPSEQQVWEIERGHWLPDDAPAKLRDELTATPDWTEVQQADTTKDEKGGGK